MQICKELQRKAQGSLETHVRWKGPRRLLEAAGEVEWVNKRVGKNNPDRATAVQGGTDEGGMRTGEKPQVEHLENTLHSTSQMQLKCRSSQAVRDLGFYSKARGNH